MHDYNNIISIHNLFLSWEEFICGKKKRKDVIEFSLNLSNNVYNLHTDLINKIYTHSPYEHFRISDPKPRDIHKATVRDRLLHHAIYRILYPYFDRKFIYDSYSCRLDKGTHKAMNRFRSFVWKVSKNNTKQCFILKCDIKKFFASIDHGILIEILNKHISDTDTIWLLNQIIFSFYSTGLGKGLPLGNLTSQLLVNIYMNEFDQYIKHKLKIKYYIRYADDFVILSDNKSYLENLIHIISTFIRERLKLSLHPNKVSIKTIHSGIDFLGWIHFPNHRILRTSTKKRMFRNINNNPKPEILVSYMGMLGHGNTHILKNKITHICYNIHNAH